MHDKVPGPIRTDQLGDLTEPQKLLIAEVIEHQFPGSRLESSPFTPLVVNQRRVETSDRLVSAGDAQDLDGFFSLVNEAIQDRLTRENIAETDRPIYVEAYPPEDIRSEAITFKLIKREPATTSQGKQMNHGRQDWRPKLREIVSDPSHPNKKLYVYGLLHDNVIELCCWARTNKAANARALWLERLMDDYRWFLKYRGVSELRYEGRLADQHTETAENKLHSRPLRYYVRTERISTWSANIVTQLLLGVTISDS